MESMQFTHIEHCNLNCMTISPTFACFAAVCPWIMLDSLPSCLALSISTSLTRPQGWARLRYLGERCKPKQVPAKAKAKLLLDVLRFSS